MKIVATTGISDIATVYIAKTSNGKYIEFVESVQPPIPRELKWVLIVSTLFGCPVGCPICDAGGFYGGKLTREEILSQIDSLITKRYPDRHVPVPKFKIQFARMGEPSYNTAVLDVLEILPQMYEAPGLIPTISTIAPQGSDRFFKRLMRIKDDLYKDRFQLQFSIHSTDAKQRDRLIPAKKWDLRTIAQYGQEFFRAGERKITLNFALAEDVSVDPEILIRYFNPELFFIKITPVNPTLRTHQNKIFSRIHPDQNEYAIIDALKAIGYEVLLSIGELEENFIGSNCGQFITHYLHTEERIKEGYTYPIQYDHEQDGVFTLEKFYERE